LLTHPDQLLLEGFIHPANSIKEWVFPRHEVVCAYRWKGKDLELLDVEGPTAKQIILAARPCDAAALPIMDPLFNWDCQDTFYNAHRQATTVVSLACATHDDSCFCTSVGLGPADPRGSDAMLLSLGNDEFSVRCLTEKGGGLFSGATRTGAADPVIPSGPQRKFDPAQVRTYLTEHFESPLWQEQTLRCLGCGVCAYTCPTCHCFDIVDEGDMAGGIRAKNWDSCQFPIFTLHASGHNPRSLQPQRQRQRVLHKFQIYPGKFGEILCTGCGNCTRNCPVNLGVLGVLEAVKDTQAL
jgi:ferredoxin